MSLLTQWVRARRRLSNLLYGTRPRPIEDPDLLLHQALEEMRVMHAKNRERAVLAITQKNNLQSLVDDTERRVGEQHVKMQLARGRGDEVLASRLLQEMESHRSTLEPMRKQLEIAIVLCDKVKDALKRDEEKIRQKTAEALTLRMHWKLIQIEQGLMISLAQISANRIDTGMPRDGLRDRHQRSRELVVEAFTHKNSLERIAADTRSKAEKLRLMTEIARRRGDEELERSLLREMEQHEAVLASTDAALRQATEVTDRARKLLEDETQRFEALQIVDPTTDRPPAACAGSAGDEEARRRASFRRALAIAGLFAIVALLLSLWPA